MTRLLATHLVLFGTLSSTAFTAPPGAAVKVSQRDLVPMCLNQAIVRPGQRSWKLAGETTFAFTMRNRPRSGATSAAPGVAVVRFRPIDGHRYEVEIRGPAESFSTHIWRQGEWKPVVRDR